ncbi:MAG TPA: type II secretion system F family protein, partial [Burkholderiales bacterium]|nr:type II secretion system F family protein [Burkholderiales bacterium]
MPNYAYTARDARGDLMRGVAEGADSSAVAGVLSASGIIPIEIRPAPAAREQRLLPWRRRSRVSRDAILLFSRQMYTLLKAGVPMLSALKGLSESAEDPQFARVLRDARATLDQGRELSYALGCHAAVFSPFFVSMVQVGEYTGTLEQVFLRLFHHLDFEKFMRDQVRAALRYPAFVLTAMAFALVIINVFVIPAFEKIFAGFRAELPLVTRALIGFSRWTITYWPLLLGIAVAAAIGFRWYVRTERGRLRWDEMKLRAP